MKTKVFSLALIAAIGILMAAFIQPEIPLSGEAPAWTIDGPHSSVTFSVRHIFTPTEGSFDKFEGSIKFDKNHLHASSANFTIAVASINTKNEKRDGHLQSGDFFDAKKYPTMKFESNSIVKNPDGGYLAAGRMTIKDVTKQVKIPFELLGEMDHPFAEGKKVAGLKSAFTINRSDYGVGSGDWASTAVVGNEVNVVINLEIAREK